jgi:hypothetical protein
LYYGTIWLKTGIFQSVLDALFPYGISAERVNLFMGYVEYSSYDLSKLDFITD